MAVGHTENKLHLIKPVSGTGCQFRDNATQKVILTRIRIGHIHIVHTLTFCSVVIHLRAISAVNHSLCFML